MPWRPGSKCADGHGETAKEHGRLFQTETGFTVIGLPSGRTPRAAAAPGVLEGAFPDGDNWQIRGHHSGGCAFSISAPIISRPYRFSRN